MPWGYAIEYHSKYLPLQFLYRILKLNMLQQNLTVYGYFNGWLSISMG